MRHYAHTLPYTVVLAMLVALLWAAFAIALPHLRGPEGLLAERPGPTDSELGSLVVQTTQYLVGLSTGILALVGLLLTEPFRLFREKLPTLGRHAIVAGAAATALSLLAGFTTFLVTLSAAAAAVVRPSLQAILMLHAIQFAGLALGVLLIGGAVLWKGVVKA